MYVIRRYVSDAEIREEKAKNKYRYREILHCTHSIRQLIHSFIFFPSHPFDFYSPCVAFVVHFPIFGFCTYTFHIWLSRLFKHVNRKMHGKATILCAHYKHVNDFFEAIYRVRMTYLLSSFEITSYWLEIQIRFKIMAYEGLKLCAQREIPIHQIVIFNLEGYFQLIVVKWYHMVIFRISLIDDAYLFNSHCHWYGLVSNRVHHLS